MVDGRTLVMNVQGSNRVLVVYVLLAKYKGEFRRGQRPDVL